MNVFQVCGFSQSGKTTLITALVRGLSARGAAVATIKDIHGPDFHIDTKGKNTWLHKEAGADPVVARSKGETDFLFTGQLDIPHICSLISADWLIVEGAADFPLPRIVCAKTEVDAAGFIDGRTFALAGAIAEAPRAQDTLRVFNPLKAADIGSLLQLVERNVFPLLPYVDDSCCGRCGLTCAGLAEKIIRGEKKRSDCVLDNAPVRLRVNGREIPMVPFVQQILRNTVTGVASELKGWQKGKDIEITISGTAV